MDGLTIDRLIEIWLLAILKYWPLITGTIAGLIITYKYLRDKAVQTEKSNELLLGILKSSESMDTTIKDMSKQMTDMNLEVTLLKTRHVALEGSHKELKNKVENIERKRK